jgi:predicted RNA-binding Zn-ribbon protein involved in translation (DUF1610 family)
MYKCPHCNEEINHLLYYENATIIGTYDIETEDYDRDDTEADGEVRFVCPNCDERINSIDDLIDTELEERDRRRRIETLTRQNPRSVFNLDSIPPEARINPTTLNGPERELPVPPAIDQNWRGEYSGYYNSHDRQKRSAILTCPKCGCKNEAIENETVECYKCGKKINLQTAKKIVEIEKPNNMHF